MFTYKRLYYKIIILDQKLVSFRTNYLNIVMLLPLLVNYYKINDIYKKYYYENIISVFLCFVYFHSGLSTIKSWYLKHLIHCR